MSKTSRARRRHSALVASLLVAGAHLGSGVSAADPLRGQGISISSPFHPDECVPAVRESLRQLRRNPDALRWRRILGQGFLCLGLKNDPAALRSAIRELSRVIDEGPDEDWQAKVALGGAYCALEPLSAEAHDALEQARRAVTARGPAQKERILQEIDANLAGLQARRQGSARSLGVSIEADAAALEQRIAALLELGPRARPAAAAAVDTLLDTAGEGSTQSVWKAELERNGGDYAAAVETLDTLLATSCRGAPPTEGDCVLAQSRRQLLAERCRDWAALAADLGISPCSAEINPVASSE